MWKEELGKAIRHRGGGFQTRDELIGKAVDVIVAAAKQLLFTKNNWELPAVSLSLNLMYSLLGLGVSQVHGVLVSVGFPLGMGHGWNVDILTKGKQLTVISQLTDKLVWRWNGILSFIRSIRRKPFPKIETR